MNEKSTLQKFTKEFKEDAIKLLLEQGYSSSETGRRLGARPHLARIYFSVECPYLVRLRNYQDFRFSMCRWAFRNPQNF
ncbi:MAG: transposase [Deltaproteobacteria bacterium]|nr:transposase [Deltaproteobacteria bacterium]